MTKIPNEVTMSLRGLGMLLVERNTWVNVFTVRMVAFGVVIGIIR